MFLREDRAAGGNPADERQRQLHDAGVRQRELMRRLVRASKQANAARRAGREFDHALACKRPQMLFSRIGRAEAQFGGDFRASGRKTGAFYGPADQIENLLLSCGEFGHGATVWMNRCLYFYTVSGAIQALL
jgi:hypothetical protein